MQGAGGASHLSLQRPAPSFTWHEASWQSPELDSACFLMSVPGSDQITVFILSHSLAAPQHHQGRHRSHLPALSSSITATSRFIMTAGVAALTSASQDGSKEHQGGTCGNSSWKTQPFLTFVDVLILPLAAHRPLPAREVGTCCLSGEWCCLNTQEEGEDRCGVSSSLTLPYMLCKMTGP